MNEKREDDLTEERRAMVERQIEARGVEDPLVLEAMETVPRHLNPPDGDILVAVRIRVQEVIGIGRRIPVIVREIIIAPVEQLVAVVNAIIVRVP